MPRLLNTQYLQSRLTKKDAIQRWSLEVFWIFLKIMWGIAFWSNANHIWRPYALLNNFIHNVFYFSRLRPGSWSLSRTSPGAWARRRSSGRATSCSRPGTSSRSWPSCSSWCRTPPASRPPSTSPRSSTPTSARTPSPSSSRLDIYCLLFTSVDIYYLLSARYFCCWCHSVAVERTLIHNFGKYSACFFWWKEVAKSAERHRYFWHFYDWLAAAEVHLNTNQLAVNSEGYFNILQWYKWWGEWRNWS